jgi:hypothetical protein
MANFKAGIPRTYLIGMVVTVTINGLVSLLLKRPNVLIIWLMTLALISGICFGLIRIWAKKAKRLPLKEHWWEETQIVAINRCPYPIEGKKLLLDPSVYAINSYAFLRLVHSDEAVPLEDAL